MVRSAIAHIPAYHRVDKHRAYGYPVPGNRVPIGSRLFLRDCRTARNKTVTAAIGGVKIHHIIPITAPGRKGDFRDTGKIRAIGDIYIDKGIFLP
jgi:hypothetical protein